MYVPYSFHLWGKDQPIPATPDRKFCTYDAAEFARWGIFPGCWCDLPEDATVFRTLLLKCTQLMRVEMERMCWVILPPFSTMDWRMMAPVVQDYIQEGRNPRGQYLVAQDGLRGNRWILRCPHFTRCLYHWQFLGAVEKRVIIAPYGQKDAIFTRLAQERALLQARLGDLNPNSPRGRHLRRLIDKQWLVVFEESMESQVYSPFPRPLSLEQLLLLHFDTEDIPVPVGPGYPPAHRYLARHCRYLRLTPPTDIPVTDALTFSLALFCRARDPLILEMNDRRGNHRNQRGSPRLFGRNTIPLVDPNHLFKVIFNCGTTSNSVMEKMTGINIWAICGSPKLPANKFWNPILPVTARSYSRKAFDHNTTLVRQVAGIVSHLTLICPPG